MFASSGRPRCTALRHRTPMTQHARYASSMTYHTGWGGWRHTRANAGFTILVPGFWIQTPPFASHKRGAVHEAAKQPSRQGKVQPRGASLQTNAAPLYSGDRSTLGKRMECSNRLRDMSRACKLNNAVICQRTGFVQGRKEPPVSFICRPCNVSHHDPNCRRIIS